MTKQLNIGLIAILSLLILSLASIAIYPSVVSAGNDTEQIAQQPASGSPFTKASIGGGAAASSEAASSEKPLLTKVAALFLFLLTDVFLLFFAMNQVTASSVKKGFIGWGIGTVGLVVALAWFVF